VLAVDPESPVGGAIGLPPSPLSAGAVDTCVSSWDGSEPLGPWGRGWPQDAQKPPAGVVARQDGHVTVIWCIAFLSGAGPGCSDLGFVVP
jgi:hypothetical protein